MAGITRRRLIGSTAAGLALAASGLAAPALARGSRIRLGYVSPRTGPLAAFSATDDWNLAAFMASDAGREFQIKVRDSRSTPEGAAEAATALVEAEQIDLLLVAGGPETAGPAAAASAAAGKPSLSTGATWEAWLLAQGLDPEDRGSLPPEGAFHMFWGIRDVAAVFLHMWAPLDTNMVVAGLFPDDADGLAWSSPAFGAAPRFAGAGYQTADPGRFPAGAGDLTATIGAFRRSSADLVAGAVTPGDFRTFWGQARAQDFSPRAATVSKALLSPAELAVYGRAGHNLSGSVAWSPKHPFVSSITGRNCAELAADYTARSREEWSQPLGLVHALFEVAVDAMGRSIDPADADATAAALTATDLRTVAGRIAWNGEGVPAHLAGHVTRTALVGGQWRRGQDGAFDLVVVANPGEPEIAVESVLEPLA